MVPKIYRDFFALGTLNDDQKLSKNHGYLIASYRVIAAQSSKKVLT